MWVSMWHRLVIIPRWPGTVDPTAVHLMTTARGRGAMSYHSIPQSSPGTQSSSSSCKHVQIIIDLMAEGTRKRAASQHRSPHSEQHERQHQHQQPEHDTIANTCACGNSPRALSHPTETDWHVSLSFSGNLLFPSASTTPAHTRRQPAHAPTRPTITACAESSSPSATPPQAGPRHRSKHALTASEPRVRKMVRRRAWLDSTRGNGGYMLGAFRQMTTQHLYVQRARTI